jgi:hypothetical protein
MASRSATALCLGLAAVAGCSRGSVAEEASYRARVEQAAAPAVVDWERPAALLVLDAGEAARRVGSFEWSGAAAFTATTRADSGHRVHVSERHRVRQLGSGEFEVEAETDDERGPGGVVGKQVLFTGGLTYARARFAPWRERPTDHGRDARRFRDESFTLVGDLARLYGPALQLTAAGEGQLLGRPVKRYAVALAAEAPASSAGADPRVFPAGGADEETRRHLAFLDGRIPLSATGEVLFDAATGVPLKARLAGAFGVKDDPRVRVQVEASGEVKTLGAKVAAINAPKNALKDSRKPAGVAAALERAGLQTREKAGGKAEPADEPE